MNREGDTGVKEQTGLIKGVVREEAEREDLNNRRQSASSSEEEGKKKWGPNTDS